MGEVVKFRGNSILPISPEESLELAKGWGLESVVVIGLTPEGEFKYGGSSCDIPLILLMLAIAQKRMVEEADQ